MSDNYLELVHRLFRKSTDVSGEASEIQDLLGQLSRLEQQQEVQLGADAIAKATRNASENASLGYVGEEAIAFRAEDGAGNNFIITVQVVNSPATLQIVGVLYANGSPIWQDFSVLMLQSEIITDFTDATTDSEFSLQLGELGPATLKFVSSDHQILMLEIETGLD